MVIHFFCILNRKLSIKSVLWMNFQISSDSISLNSFILPGSFHFTCLFWENDELNGVSCWSSFHCWKFIGSIIFDDDKDICALKFKSAGYLNTETMCYIRCWEFYFLPLWIYKSLLILPMRPSMSIWEVRGHK